MADELNRITSKASSPCCRRIAETARLEIGTRERVRQGVVANVITDIEISAVVYLTLGTLLCRTQTSTAHICPLLHTISLAHAVPLPAAARNNLTRSYMDRVSKDEADLPSALGVTASRGPEIDRYGQPNKSRSVRDLPEQFLLDKVRQMFYYYP